jgi:HK97 family phage prohead protease
MFTRSAHIEKASGDTFTFVASDATEDRMGDIIDPKGWELSTYQANPVVLFGHKHDEPIGRASAVTVKGGKLYADIEFMPEEVSAFAAKIGRMVKAGFIKAVSVGFRALDAKPNEKSPGGLIFTKSELLEISVVSVPANPSALAVAKAFEFSDNELRRVFEEQKKVDPLALQKRALEVMKLRGRG